MKKILILLLVLFCFLGCYFYKNQIIIYLTTLFTNVERNSTELENNKFAGKQNYDFIQLTDDFEPKNQQEIINIYYTVLNSGMTEFTFYCPKQYKDCIKDVNYISDNQILLSYINNFVPVYNNFDNIETEFDSLGKVTIYITHNYTSAEITELENKVSEIINEIIKEDMQTEEKIKVIHDYIINHTKYDVERSDKKVNLYRSDTAYGALIEHYAICGGYADSMKLFLDYLNIPNYKISSENHIWNLVYLHDGWYHLDLTWDDPVVLETDKDVLEYNYFLITTEELKMLETEQHIFDEDIYKEAKSN